MFYMPQKRQMEVVMKKVFWGYNISEVDVAIGALREENESLNATITTLKTHIKNIESGYSAKSKLLESNLKEKEGILRQTNDEKQKLEEQILELNNHITEVTAHENNQSAAALDTLQSQLNTEIEYKASMEKELTEKEEELSCAKEELASARRDLTDIKLQLDSLKHSREDETSKLQALSNKYENIETEMKDTKSAYEITANELENTKALLHQKEQDAARVCTELEDLKKQLAAINSHNAEHADKLIAIEHLTSNYNNMKEILSDTQASLTKKTTELENCQAEIQQLKDSLSIAEAAAEEQAKLKEQENMQLANYNYASEISLKAYYDMGQIRSEVYDYLHKQMKDYYQLVNDNSTKMHSAIEQCQTEYNHMLRELFAKLSEFRLSLSNIDDEYNNTAEYSINVDRISNRMSEIIENFMKESSASLKKNEEKLDSVNESGSENESGEKGGKSLNIQDFISRKNDKQGYL